MAGRSPSLTPRPIFQSSALASLSIRSIQKETPIASNCAAGHEQSPSPEKTWVDLGAVSVRRRSSSPAYLGPLDPNVPTLLHNSDTFSPPKTSSPTSPSQVSSQVSGPPGSKVELMAINQSIGQNIGVHLTRGFSLAPLLFEPLCNKSCFSPFDMHSLTLRYSLWLCRGPPSEASPIPLPPSIRPVVSPSGPISNSGSGISRTVPSFAPSGVIGTATMSCGSEEGESQTVAEVIIDTENLSPKITSMSLVLIPLPHASYLSTFFVVHQVYVLNIIVMLRADTSSDTL